MANHRDVRGAAFHEAGHAVAAAMLDCEIIGIDITAGHAAGGASIKHKCGLSFVNRIAICIAGIVAQEIFDAPTNENAGGSDNGKIATFLDGLDPKTDAAIRSAGRESACRLLRQYEGAVNRVAQYLIEHQKMDGITFSRVFVGHGVARSH